MPQNQKWQHDLQEYIRQGEEDYATMQIRSTFICYFTFTQNLGLSQSV